MVYCSLWASPVSWGQQQHGPCRVVGRIRGINKCRSLRTKPATCAEGPWKHCRGHTLPSVTRTTFLTELETMCVVNTGEGPLHLGGSGAFLRRWYKDPLTKKSWHPLFIGHPPRSQPNVTINRERKGPNMEKGGVGLQVTPRWLV